MKEKNEIYGRALKLAVPMMIQNGITNMVGLIDNVMVGSLGTEAITGVSIIGQLIFVFNLAVFGGLSGPGIYSAQFFGQSNDEGVKNTFRIKLWISIFCMVLGICVFIFGGDFLIGLYLKGESATVDADLVLVNAKQYLQIMLLNIVPFVFTQTYASTLRETGESVKPMVAGIVSVLVDIVMNYILIYGHLFFPKLGVRGAAIATVLARIVEFIIVVVWSHAKREKHTFLIGIYKTLLVPRDLFFKVIKKGAPIFVNEFLWAGGIAVMTQCYSARSLDAVAGLNISNALCNLLNVVFVAMGSAVGILIGQMLGASEYKKAEKSAIKLMLFTGLLCVGLTVILVAISGVFPEFYDTSEEIKQMATYFIIITALFFPIQGFLNALYFTIRSGGKTFITFLFDGGYTWTVTVPVSYLLCLFTDISIFGVFAIVQAADIIKVIVGYILIRKGVWINNIVE